MLWTMLKAFRLPRASDTRIKLVHLPNVSRVDRLESTRIRRGEEEYE
jgi:hypothetical protein